MAEVQLPLKRSKSVVQVPSVTYHLPGPPDFSSGSFSGGREGEGNKGGSKSKEHSGAQVVPGLGELYEKFLPDLSTVLSSLYQLLHKDSSWNWQQAQEKVFQQVKEPLHSAPLLVRFDPDTELILSITQHPMALGQSFQTTWRMDLTSLLCMCHIHLEQWKMGTHSYRRKG